MLKVENLIKDYSTGFIRKKVRVLKGVSFDVKKSEIFGFIGPNGAGKTTTFKSILNFVSITEGNIQINGKPNTDNGLKSYLGYLPESPYFYDYLTGEELLNYMGNLHGVEKNILKDRIDELLEKVNMAHARKMQLRKYSKGMLQRIGVAQALINDPEFLILDEPMSGLDPIGRREIRDLILEQKIKGKTILLSSHILSDVESLCDRVGVILNGVVVKIGALCDLYKEINSDYEMLLNCKKEQANNIIKSDDVFVDQRAGFIVLRFGENRKKEIVNAILESELEMISLFPLRKSLEGIFEEEARKREIGVES
ncbi:MAG: ABC transporter ATP-binding protein [Thermodesulfobacteriota bacterium]